MGCATWCFCIVQKKDDFTSHCLYCLFKLGEHPGCGLTRTFLDTCLFQIYACATFSSANSATWPPARSAWSWRRPSGRHSSALTALGPSLGIPMCPRYPTLWGWWMWMKRTSTPTTLCQVPAVFHEKSVFFLHVFWPLKNTVCLWFGSLATASLRGSSCVLCFFFSFDLPYSTWYDMYI